MPYVIDGASTAVLLLPIADAKLALSRAFQAKERGRWLLVRAEDRGGEPRLLDVWVASEDQAKYRNQGQGTLGGYIPAEEWLGR